MFNFFIPALYPNLTNVSVSISLIAFFPMEVLKYNSLRFASDSKR